MTRDEALELRAKAVKEIVMWVDCMGDDDYLSLPAITELPVWCQIHGVATHELLLHNKPPLGVVQREKIAAALVCLKGMKYDRTCNIEKMIGLIEILTAVLAEGGAS